jgi:hypothetical protein
MEGGFRPVLPASGGTNQARVSLAPEDARGTNPLLPISTSATGIAINALDR